MIISSDVELLTKYIDAHGGISFFASGVCLNSAVSSPGASEGQRQQQQEGGSGGQ